MQVIWPVAEWESPRPRTMKENELPRGRQAPPDPPNRTCLCLEQASICELLQTPPLQVHPRLACALLSPTPALGPATGHGALQRTARKFPAHSVLDTLCQTPTAEHGAVAGWPAELEGWEMAGPHPCGPGGFGPVCQRSCCHGCTEPCQVRVASPPAAWP